MDSRDWEKLFIPYEQAVDELVMKFENLKSQYITLEEYSPIELVLGRVKKLSSLLDKIKKYNIPMDQIEEKIDDIAGIRIICQFVDDIDQVVGLIKVRDGKDLKILDEKDYIRHEKESGYRSYHIIISYPVQYALGSKEIIAEIQIRTLAMNFWATIEHSINYKYKHNIPDNIEKRLKNAAEAAFLLDQEMYEIREEIRDSQKVFNIRSNTISQILHYIQKLYKLGKVEMAEEYQSTFAQLWEKGDLTKLMNLEHDLSELVNEEIL